MVGDAHKLKKSIGFFGVFAVAFGTTIAGGFFLLPGMAFSVAGPAIILSYVLAGLVVLLPSICKCELATAMPRAGGIYFYLDRAFGPMAGCIAGIGTWIALSLKTSFALVGLGFYVGLFFEGQDTTLIAVLVALAFGMLNIIGAGKASALQNMLVILVLLLLSWFTIDGTLDIKAARFSDFFGQGETTMISMIGIVLISYVGLTKVASIAEEVKNPDRNIPMGVLLALGMAMLLYVLGLGVMIGTVPADQLAATKTPAADAAMFFAGRNGQVVISIAAIAAFMSVANAGILSTSRYPFAMGRDHTFPTYFRKIGRFRTPTRAIVVTVALIVLEILFLDPLIIAKYAGTLMLLLFAGICMALIVMRQSRIDSYDPGFKAPLYPILPIIGIVACLACIIMLGWVPVLFTAGLITLGILWFQWYASKRVHRIGAIHHIFAQLGRQQFDRLDVELREIIKEKGLRKTDPFEEVVADAFVIDLPKHSGFTAAASLAAAAIGERSGLNADTLQREFLEGTRIGSTPVAGGAALPHTRSESLTTPELVIVRCNGGMDIEVGNSDQSLRTQHVDAIFFLVSPEADPGLHLRLLASLAIAVEQPTFLERWRAASGGAGLKASLLRHERSLDVRLRPDAPSSIWIDMHIRDLNLPEDVIVTLIGRDGKTVVPRGSTQLHAGDRVVLLGEPEGISILRTAMDLE